MKAKEYMVLERCVEEGVSYGFNRAHKHTDKPSEDQIKEHIHSAVMNEICEWFEFDDREVEE